MFAPGHTVALRFVTYSIPVSPESRHFVEQVQALESIREWVEEAKQEPEVISFIDELALRSETSLTPG